MWTFIRVKMAWNHDKVRIQESANYHEYDETKRKGFRTIAAEIRQVHNFEKYIPYLINKGGSRHLDT